MGRRKTTRKAPASADKLVPALRDALAIADRALKQLSHPPSKRKRAKRKGTR
jgi:hypothetical protein